jgi:muramidase (phage lysozyme)
MSRNTGKEENARKMADFTNRIQEQNVPDNTNRSRGYSDSSVGDLFKNLGSTIKTTAAVFDKAGEKIAADSVTEAIDKFNIEAGVYGTGAGELPGDLKAQFDRAKKMYAASQRAGGSLSSHYYSRLVSTMRDLRQKYPGYGDAIDKQVASIVGYNPREAATRSFLQDAASRDKQLEEGRKELESFYSSPDTAALIGIKDPASVSQEQFAKDRRYVLEWNTKQARFDQLAKEGRINAQTADEVATHYMSGAFTRIYNEGALGDFLRTGEAPTDTGEMEELIARSRTLIPQLRVALTSQMSKMIGPGFSSEDMTKIIDAKMKDIQPIVDAVGSKDFTAAAHGAKMFSWQEDEAKRKLIDQFGPTLFMQKNLEAQFGKEHAAVLLNQMAAGEGHVDYAAMLTSVMASNPNQTYDKGLDSIIQNNTTTRDEKNKTVRSYTETTIKSMTAATDDQKFLQMAEKMYKPEVLNRVFSQIEDGDLDFLQFVMPKVVTDRFAKIGGDAAQEYLLNTTTAFLQSEELRNLRTQFTRDDLPEGKFFIMQNGSLQFKTQEEINKGFAGGTTAQSQLVNSSLQEINGNLANIKYAHDKIGGGDYSKLIRDLGIEDALPIKALEAEQNQPDPRERPDEVDQNPPGSLMEQGLKELREQNPAPEPQTQEQALENVTATKTVLNNVSERLSQSVASVEGTSGPSGPDTILGYQQDRFGVKPSTMTLGELKEFTNPRGAYAAYSKEKVGRVATPLGKYQIVGTTLRKLQKELGLPDDTVFNEDTQDQMFLKLLEGRGWQKFMDGDIDAFQMAANLSKEWEGFARFKDRGDLAIELQDLKRMQVAGK